MIAFQRGDIVTFRSGAVATVVYPLWYGDELIPVARLTVESDDMQYPADVRAVVLCTRGGVEVGEQLELFSMEVE